MSPVRVVVAFENVIGVGMNNRPEIIISSLDVYRIYNLMDALPANSFTGKEELVLELARGKMVAPTDIPPMVVTMNSTIRFCVESPGKNEFVQTLVYRDDDDASGNKISILTPVGSALIGLSQGDEIEWPRADGGLMKVKVMEILYQPERAGEFQR